MASGSSTPTSSDREQLMFLGKECHHPSCHLHDFLPFSCPACHESFCQPHFLPSQHACTAPLPASMVDRIAPSCPLCNEVVSYPPGGREDPNEAVERHILSGTCSAMEGGEARKRAELKAKKERGEICYRRGCTKHIVVPMKCEACAHIFCPTHRHQTSHSCTATPSSSRTPTPVQPPARSAAKSAMSRLIPPISKPSSSTTPATAAPGPQLAATSSQPRPVTANQTAAPNPIEARAAAAAAAMKRAGQDAKIPFIKTKTEKRAEDEMASRMKALKARHEKGLLTKAEEVKYAELVGEGEARRRRSGGGKDDGCTVA